MTIEQMTEIIRAELARQSEERGLCLFLEDEISTGIDGYLRLDELAAAILKAIDE